MCALLFTTTKVTMDAERNYSDTPTGVLSEFERHQNLQTGKVSFRNKSEEMKGFGPRFEINGRRIIDLA